MRGKINVLFIHTQNGFGADSAIHGHLMRNLDRERFAVHLACSRGDASGTSRSLTIFREIPDVRLRPTCFAPGFRHRSRETILKEVRASGAFPVDFARLAGYVVRERIDVIHGTNHPRDAVYTVGLAKLTRAKSVVHVHVGWTNAYSAPAKWGVHAADAVFSISRFVTDTIVRTGTPRDRVHTVLNGIDPSRWDSRIDGSTIRREFGVPAGAPLLVSVSRLFESKGQRELVQAFARVRQRIGDAWLMIVGADALEVHGGSFTAELKALASELGVADRVVFTGERADIPEVMAACDVFTLPSFGEPFGLVYLEAMAMERPVVSVDNGGTPEVVEHGRSGLLGPPRDVPALTANIITLLENRDLRARMGAYGRSRVLEYFNVTRMARDAGAAYERVLGGLHSS
jgi:glycosyltransferase involved in cell wall biosynthesis